MSPKPRGEHPFAAFQELEAKLRGRPQDFAIADPVRLEAQIVRTDGNRWALVAEGADGSRLTIIASAERFLDALRPRSPRLHRSHDEPPRHTLEQLEAMFVRGEISVETFEEQVERELRQ